MPTPNLIKAPTRELRIFIRHVGLRMYGIKVDPELARPDRVRRSDDAEVAYLAAGLNEHSVVYSFGIGAQISWDREIIDRFGATVHGFDPSPATVEWARTASLPKKFIFHPIGIAGHDGTLRLYPPRTSDKLYYSCINRNDVPEERAIEVPVKRFATIAAEFGHDHVDLLKIDVDGAEYAILPDILESGIPVGQMLIEFHHDFKTLTYADTRMMIARLRERGYRIFDISHRAREFSFVKVP